MGKAYLIVADSGRLFRLHDHGSSWEWFVFDDGKFESYELQMDVMQGNSRLQAPKAGAHLMATFPGENKITQGRIVEVYKKT